jgi:hypothetical protein
MGKMMERRQFVGRSAGILSLMLIGRRSAAQMLWAATGDTITVYKSANCGCCAKWVEHLRESNFAVTVYDQENMDQIKDQLGVPPALRSCHTAVVGSYLIEGHVPASDIRRLLAERPKLAGLAAPGMPAQSPGMAEAGAKPQGYDVLAFQADGASHTFTRY